MERWLERGGWAWRPVAMRLDRWASWLVLVGAMGLVFALYGRALGFAFLFDDTYDLTRWENRSYWQIASSSEGYSYYRPIPFLIWKLLRTLQGHYDQPTLHAIPLVVHAVSGWLLYLLVRRLGAGHWAVLPALLFLTAPFHYQSVPIVGTLFHPMAGMAILASLVLYHGARVAAGGWVRHVAALVCTVMALWSHESGIAVAALVVGLEGLLLWQRRSWRPSPWLAGHLAAAGLFVLTWLTVEKAPFGDRTTLDELHPKALFFFQGFTYPVSAQIQWLHDHRGIDLGIVEVGVTALALAFATYLVSGWMTGRRWAAVVPLLGLGIGLAASAPSLARLSWGYVENSPRLLYLVTIGSALLWGLLPSLSFRYRLLTWGWRVGTVAAILFVVGQSWRFIEIRMEMYREATAIVDGVVAAGERYQGQKLLVMNAPSWFAQARYEYLYGHYGIQIMPSYIGLDRVIYTSSQRAARTAARSATRNAQVSLGRYPFGPHGPDATLEELDAWLRQGHHLVEVQVNPLVDVAPEETSYQVRDIGRIVPGGADEGLELAGRLGNGLWLTDVRAVTVEGRTTLYFAWHASAAWGVDGIVVVEVRDAGGRAVSVYEGYSLGGYSAPRLWQQGDRIDDSVAFDDLPDGSYSVFVGMRLERGPGMMPAFDREGRALADGMVPVGELIVADGATTVGAAP